MTGSCSPLDEDNPVELKLEDEVAQGPSFSLPSFSGRLNISKYAYKSKAPSPSPPLGGHESSSSNVQRSLEPLYSARTANQASTGVKRKERSLGFSNSPSPSKKSRSPSGYAPPSTYAHLPPLPDVLEPGLICIFVGLNPGIRTATSGHAYAHPSNLFWKLLHSSGCTTRRCRPEEDVDLPRLFSLGNTNIVERPTRNGSELSKKEMDDSVKALQLKININRPEAVCIVGKSIWESVWRVRHGKPIKKDEFRYGWQEESENMGVSEDWEGAKLFVASSTSGLAATLLPAQKEAIWRELGSWVEQRRAQKTLELHKEDGDKITI